MPKENLKIDGSKNVPAAPTVHDKEMESLQFGLFMLNATCDVLSDMALAGRLDYITAVDSIDHCINKYLDITKLRI